MCDMVGVAECVVGVAEYVVGVAEYVVGVAEYVAGVAEYVVGVAECVVGVAECVKRAYVLACLTLLPVLCHLSNPALPRPPIPSLCAPSTEGSCCSQGTRTHTNGSLHWTHSWQGP